MEEMSRLGSLFIQMTATLGMSNWVNESLGIKSVQKIADFIK
jgi:hypothetical protein